MSVYGVEGTPGAGKTLYAISEFILPALLVFQFITISKG